MTNEDLQHFEHILYRDCVQVIESFADSEHNKDVYVFVLQFETDRIGSLAIGINTLSGLEQTKKRYARQSYSREELEGTGLGSLKWRPEDFYYWRFREFSEEMAKIEEKYRDHLTGLWEENRQLYHERFTPYGRSIAKVMEQQLLPHFAVLNWTDDFIAYHGYAGMEEDIAVTYMLGTVHADKLRRMFPESDHSILSEMMDGVHAQFQDASYEEKLKALFP